MMDRGVGSDVWNQEVWAGGTAWIRDRQCGEQTGVADSAGQREIEKAVESACGEDGGGREIETQEKLQR